MKRTRHYEAFELLQQSEQVRPLLITEAHLLGLPEPVQRYLRYAQVIGKETIRAVRLKQKGFMRLQPGQKWLPMVAEQYFTTNPPTYLWHGTIKPFPLLSMSGTDRFSDGHGNMLIQLFSFITLADAYGPGIDQGALLRYLPEMTWFPTAWLSDYIQWQAIDAQLVKATISYREVTASALLSVNEQGQITHLTAERYRSEHGQYRLERWSGRFNAYQEASGLHIPTDVEVIWHLDVGDFSYFRGKLSEIEYNQSGNVTML
jgi:hypothetical protein